MTARFQSIFRYVSLAADAKAGADHYFAGREAELAKQARLFLDQHLK